MPEEHHIWIVDSIEEEVAAVEEDGERLRHVPLWLLPRGVAEGALLRVSTARTGTGEVVVRVTHDAAGSAAEGGSPPARQRPRNAADPGGDIVL